jgi:hypothetical protein
MSEEELGCPAKDNKQAEHVIRCSTVVLASKCHCSIGLLAPSEHWSVPMTGLQFGELIDHFVIGANEACLMSDAHGNLHIIGTADKKKHERKSGDVRCSITIFRTGTSSGANGPTGFLLKGQKKRI